MLIGIDGYTTRLCMQLSICRWRHIRGIDQLAQPLHGDHNPRRDQKRQACQQWPNVTEFGQVIFYSLRRRSFDPLAAGKVYDIITSDTCRVARH